MTPGDRHGQPPPRSIQGRVASYLLTTPIIFAPILFLPAGTWARRDGWIFILASLSAGTAAGRYAVRANPEILIARSRVHEGTKGGDRILLGFLIPIMLSIFPVAASTEAYRVTHGQPEGGAHDEATPEGRVDRQVRHPGHVRRRRGFARRP